MSKLKEQAIQQTVGIVAAATIAGTPAVASSVDQVELEVDQNGRISLVLAPESLSEEVVNPSPDDGPTVSRSLLNVNCYGCAIA